MAAPTAVAPAQAADVKFTIQVGAFSKSKSAESLRRRLEKEKLTVVVKQINVRGTLYHVVRVGEFPTAAAAETFAVGLKKRQKLSYRVIEE